MKYISILISIFFSFNVIAQIPEGKLFVQLSSNSYILPKTLGYIEYPQEQYIFIDSTNITDMLIHNNSLFVASDIIYEYDLSTNQKIDSIENSQPIQIEIWENYILVKSSTAPFIRAYDINNNSQAFFFDTSKVPYPPADFTVYNDKAFLVLNNTVQILDLISLDTISTILTPHPFPFGGMNYFVFEINEEIYIDVEYATGAPRFSLLKMNPQNFVVETLFHQEMAYNIWKPIVGDEIIYISHFPSYYDITLDSMIAAPWGNSFAIDYDQISNSVFVYDIISKDLQYFNNGIASLPITFSNDLLLTLFVPANNQNIQTQPEDFSTCENAIAIFFIVAENSQNFQWQENSGTGFYNITNSVDYSGANTDSLEIINSPFSMDGYQYRCIVTDSSENDTSEFAILTVNARPQNFSISGEVAVFETQTNIYSVPFDSSLIYEWNIQNGTLLNQISNDSILVQWGNAGFGIISVIAENSYACFSDSVILNIFIGINSVEKFPDKNNIKIYPNPNNFGFIHVFGDKCYNIEIYDNTGNQVLFSENKYINTSNLQTGVYFVLIKNKENELLKVEKLFIIN